MNPHPSRRRGGFTIAELIIGVSLSLMVMTAVLSSYVFIARSYARTVGFGDPGKATLESQGRRTLAYFTQDVQAAVGLGVPDAANTYTVSTTQFTLILPTGTGGTKLVTYCCNLGSSDAYAAAPCASYSVPKKSLVRIDGATATLLVLHTGLKDQPNGVFSYYDIAGRPYTTYTKDSYLGSVKQMSMSLNAQAGSSANGTLTALYQVASPRLLLRNKMLLP